MRDWIKFGYAPVPVDIRKNIRNFSLNYPLEYNEIMDKYNITASNYDMLQFSLYAGRHHILVFKCDLHKEYCYSITFYYSGSKITLCSKNGYTFERKSIKNVSSNYRIKVWKNILEYKEIQNMLGIISYSHTKIEFLNPKLQTNLKETTNENERCS